MHCLPSVREIVNQYNEAAFLKLKQQILISAVSWGMSELEHNKSFVDCKSFQIEYYFSIDICA